MTTPSSGVLAFSHLNTEVRKGASDIITMNDAPIRKLAGIPSGTIAMSDLRGKSYEIRIEINQNNFNFDTTAGMYQPVLAALNGRDFASTEIVIVNNSVLVSATTSLAVFDFSGFSWCPKLTLINNGGIYGRGGNGGEAGRRWSNPGYPGGPAITLPPYQLNLYNYGIIAGGGGGGGANNGYDWDAPPTHCLSFDTYVLLYSGEYQLIQHLHPGDIVASFNGDRIVPGKVLSLRAAGYKSAYRISGKDFSIISSPEHPFFTKGGYAAIDNMLLGFTHPDLNISETPLQPGVKLLDSYGRELVVTKIEKLAHEREMYTLDIEDGLDTFYASADTKNFILTHNKKD